MAEILTDRPTVIHPKIVHGTMNGYSNYKCRCDACSLSNKDYRSKQYLANKDRFISYSLIKNYGITLAERNEILSRQDGRCGACGAKEGSRRHSVDHDHTTGEVRGILCQTCNMALGLLKEDDKIIIGLLKYLRGFKK